MQTNTGKTNIFQEIICIYKHFTVENILRRNKRSLVLEKAHHNKFTLNKEKNLLTIISNHPWFFDTK
jgi:hypothetical protein